MENTAKLTKVQQDLKKQFDAGRRIKKVNAHYANGGEYRFTDNNELCRYRTFWNLINAIYGHQKPYPKENYFEVETIKN